MTTFSIVLMIFFAAALIGWLWTCLSLAAARRQIDDIEESFLGQIEKYREAVSREYANHASCNRAKEELEVASKTIEKLTADLCHAVGTHGATVSELIDLRNRYLTHKNFVFQMSRVVEEHRKSLVEE